MKSIIVKKSIFLGFSPVRRLMKLTGLVMKWSALRELGSILVSVHVTIWRTLNDVVQVRVSNRNFLHENRLTIAQRFSYVSSKNCTKFRYIFALMRKSYFAQILMKILVFAYFVVFCYFVISTYFVFSSFFVKFWETIAENELINH